MLFYFSELEENILKSILDDEKLRFIFFLYRNKNQKREKATCWNKNKIILIQISERFSHK